MEKKGEGTTGGKSLQNYQKKKNRLFPPKQGKERTKKLFLGGEREGKKGDLSKEKGLNQKNFKGRKLHQGKDQGKGRLEKKILNLQTAEERRNQEGEKNEYRD